MLKVLSGIRHVMAVAIRRMGMWMISAGNAIGLVALAALGCHHSAKPAETPSPQPASDNVSVGYGTQSRAGSNVAVGTVDSTSLGQQTITTWEQLIVGRVAGVQVVNGPSGMTLRVRGIATLSGDAEPLVVVDGVALAGTSNLLLSVSPGDVERIEVLKDAGSTAIYGSRGANGVILVTLKKRVRQ
jgi:TonB-dependent SusC/RagA subfamily outer membrane receptor